MVEHTTKKFKTGAVPETVKQVAEMDPRGPKMGFAARVVTQCRELAKKRGTELQSVHIPEEEFYKLFGHNKTSISYFKTSLKKLGINPAMGFEDGVLHVWSRGDYKNGAKGKPSQE